MMKSTFRWVSFMALWLVLGLVAAEAKEQWVAPDTIPGATTIDAGKAKAMFDSKTAFLDPRKDSDYQEGHVPGAVHLDLTTLTKEAMEARFPDKSQAIVVYCNGIRCKRSTHTIPKLVEWGYTNVYFFREGLPAWVSEDFPVE
jgi:rhodanese-related sulfurtransferase